MLFDFGKHTIHGLNLFEVWSMGKSVISFYNRTVTKGE